MRAQRAEFARDDQRNDADAPADTVIVVRSKRLDRTTFAVAIARELPAVFTVVSAGASALQGERDGAGLALAAAELIAGAAVLIAIGFEARHLFGRRAAHGHDASHQTQPPKVNLSNLAAAALGYVEAWHHAREVGHLKLISPNMVGATASLLMARFQTRPLSARRKRRRLYVGITPHGLTYVGGRRRKWKVAWTQVAAVEHGHGELAVRLHDGRRYVLHAEHHLDGESVLAQTRAAIADHAPHVPGAVDGKSHAAYAAQ